MAKNIKPVMGYYVDDYLEQILKEVEGSDPDRSFNGPRMGRTAKETRGIVQGVRGSLNTGTCMNEAQAGDLRRTILYSRGSDTAVTKELVDRVNGFRLECGNCLNMDCGKRDKGVSL